MQYLLPERYEEFKIKLNEWINTNLNSEIKIFNYNLLDKLKKAHLYGFHSPKAFGGHGKDFLYHVIALTEISKLNPRLAMSTITDFLFEQNVFKYENKENIEKYVNPIIQGEEYVEMELFQDDQIKFVIKSCDQDDILDEFYYDNAVLKRTLINSHLSVSAFILGLLESKFNKLISNKSKDDNYSILASEIEAARLLIYKAAELRSNGVESNNESAQAKVFTVELFNKYISELDDKEYIDQLGPFISNLEDINKLFIEEKEENTTRLDVNKTFNTSERKQIIFDSSNNETNVIRLLEALKNDDLYCKNSDYDIYQNIEKSERVVSFGLGIGDRENIKTVEDFSKLICATIACTLPISEELEWMPVDRLVGINGKEFKGDIYFALGLSGSIQHTYSIRSANTVIAINTDEHAPIFTSCDYGIVGDLNEILPILISKITK